VRILVWHGYLLSGTGSNIYTQALVHEWASAGHDVTVFSQEPHPERFDLGGATAVKPYIGRLLPVFVLDRYEGLEARLLQDFTLAEREAYVEANAAELREHLPADLVFANHVLLGGPVGAATGARYAVKAHGSELEYSMRGNAELSAWGKEGLERAGAVFVGSGHIRQVLDEIVGHVENVHEVPPGVDVDEFRPEARDVALAALIEEARQDPPNAGNANERLPDEGNAERLAHWFESDEPTVLYFGKLLYNKGVHVLFDALRKTGTRAIVVGFGDYREELEWNAPPRALFTGALDHRHLRHLVSLCDVTVVPSIFPEAFGMVAAESAAAGTPPLVARHSGLEEIAEGLEAEYPPEHRSLTSFATGDADDLAEKLEALLALPPDERRRIAEAGRRAVERNWSWARVGERLLDPFS
jgi:glycosyltransferase involved in cell wall biosynthesis